MVESEIKILLALHSIKIKGKLSHEIIIGFKCPIEDFNDIDRFVTATQSRIDGNLRESATNTKIRMVKYF